MRKQMEETDQLHYLVKMTERHRDIESQADMFGKLW